MNRMRGAERRPTRVRSFSEIEAETDVDEVLADFTESSPEEIMALDDADDGSPRADETVDEWAPAMDAMVDRAAGATTGGSSPADDSVPDSTFDGFVLEEPRRVSETDSESTEELDGPSMDELFGKV